MDTAASLDVGSFLTVAVTGGAALGGLILALFAWLRSDIRDLRHRLDSFIDSHGPVRPEASDARAAGHRARSSARRTGQRAPPHRSDLTLPPSPATLS